MAEVSQELLENLLHMEEGATLDFKREQYPLSGADDKAKSELVKDVLAFANAWKASDAYILIGVEEVKGGRSVVLGVKKHLEDANLQQLVGAKTNRPLDFQYLAMTIDERSVGLIRISAKQERPIYLTRDFGRLKQDAVYIRRGSSTGEATTGEIERMAQAQIQQESPSISLEFADSDGHAGVGRSISITSTLLHERPDVQSGPADVGVFRRSRFGLETVTASLMPGGGPSVEDWNEHHKEIALLSEVRLYVTNNGRASIHDTQVRLEIPKDDALHLLDEFPEPPRSALEVISASMYSGIPSSTCVESVNNAWVVTTKPGKIQPGGFVVSDPFWVGSSNPNTIKIVATVYGDNLPEPIEAQLSIGIETATGLLPEPVEDPHQL